MTQSACPLSLVITFNSTVDAMQVEQLCTSHGVAGRLIPLPTQIAASCGLAWRTTPEYRQDFDGAVLPVVQPSGYYELNL